MMSNDVEVSGGTKKCSFNYIDNKCPPIGILGGWEGVPGEGSGSRKKKRTQHKSVKKTVLIINAPQ